MATTIVELSGDEAGLLRSLQRVIDKEREHERQLRATGDAGDYAGQGLEAALDRVRKAEDRTLKSLMGDLRKLGPEGQAAAQALTSHFSDSGRAGLKSFASVIDQIKAIDPAAAAVLDAVRAEFAATTQAANFDRALESLKRLGPEGSALAKGIAEDIAKASAASSASLDDVVADIIRMRPEAAESAARIKAELTEAARVSEFNETLDSLKRLGPEGAAIAKGIQEDMAKAAAASAGGLDDVLDKIKQMDPTAATSAERVRTELAEAARFTEGRFASTLAELRKIGPVGQQVAAEMRKHLVTAGEISERSIDDVIAKIRQIDPAAADAAKRMHEEIEAANAKGELSFENFSQKAIQQVGAIAGAYLSVQRAIAAVDQHLKDQERHLKNAHDRQLGLGKVQQEALKGYSTLSPDEQDHLINVAPAQIEKETGVPRIFITQALGNIDSSASVEQSVDAVDAAARINKLTPEQISDFAVGAVDLGRTTGLDARSNIALMQSLYEVGAVKDLQKIANQLSPAVQAATATVPNQDPVEAAIDTTGLFAVIGKGLGDPDGARTLTATNLFTARMQAMFEGLDQEMIKSRSEIEKIQTQITRAEGQRQRDIEERDRLAKLLAGGDSVAAPDRSTLDAKIEKARLEHERKEVDARQTIRDQNKKSGGGSTEKTRFEARAASTFLGQSAELWEQQRAKLEQEWAKKQEQAEKQRTERLRNYKRQLDAINLRLETGSEFEKQRADLERHKAFLADAEGFVDPGTIAGRRAAIEQNPGLRAQFYSTPFGGDNAGPVLQAITDPNSKLTQELAENRSEIRADRQKFEDLARPISGKDCRFPDVNLGVSAQQLETIRQRSEFEDREGARLEQVRTAVTATLTATRPAGWLAGTLASLGETGIARGSLLGSTAAEEAVSGIGRLTDRRGMLIAQGLGEDSQQIVELDRTIQGLRDLLVASPGVLAPGSMESAERMASTIAGVMSRPESDIRDNLGAAVPRRDPRAAELFSELATDLRLAIERQNALVEQQNKLLAEQKALAEQQTQAAQQTATNTTPPARQPNYAAGQQAAAAYGSAP